MANNYTINKEKARQEAIDWQTMASCNDLSYSELADYGEYFTKKARRYGLLKEFRENCII